MHGLFTNNTLAGHISVVILCCGLYVFSSEPWLLLSSPRASVSPFALTIFELLTLLVFSLTFHARCICLTLKF